MDSRFETFKDSTLAKEARKMFGPTAFVMDDYYPMSCRFAVGLCDPDGEGEWTLLGSGPSFEAAFKQAVPEFANLDDSDHLPHLRDAPNTPQDDWNRQLAAMRVK